ncbi:tRNA (Ile)-lysidine synthase [Rhynchospora pubera]|uniref:tRNA (Ile)-lysidine synthase n=1 Tax=Rhynchospora pubera TaxID=906938 RepID=A0AAV8GZN5_9POAL|nr:tRNA (Ile)-lysidine synthase [Rhynchospora pubera]
MRIPEGGARLIKNIIEKREERRERRRKKKKKMVAIALYRGNLHRVPNTPRRWPGPARSMSSSQFKSLLRRRSRALSRLTSLKDKDETREVQVEVKAEAEEEQGDKGEPEEAQEEPEEGELPHSDPPPSPNAEASTAPDAGGLTLNKEERKMQLEKKLQELNQTKHNLVQMLKQILNAEEEMKRRISQPPVTRGPITLPSENGPDVPSASRPGPPRISVEVNFGTDLGGESDPGSTQSAPTRPFGQMQSPSPSASSLSRSPFSNAPRGPLASSSLLGNPLTAPASFIPPTGQLSHASSLPPLLPLPGSTFVASSPSPAASGGTPSASVFRDSRFGGSS